MKIGHVFGVYKNLSQVLKSVTTKVFSSYEQYYNILITNLHKICPILRLVLTAFMRTDHIAVEGSLMYNAYIVYAYILYMYNT
jgi:hypothetical protein